MEEGGAPAAPEPATLAPAGHGEAGGAGAPEAKASGEQTGAAAQAAEPEDLPVRVAVNVRPLIGTERASGCAPVLECRAPAAGSSGDATIEANGRTFPYDFVYAPGTAEERLYDECVAPLVEGLFKGYNATVLAYGQTGSGKTYTMGTAYTPGAPPQGVTPRAMADICDRADAMRDFADVSVRASFIELHEKVIHDLLDTSGKGASDRVAIREAAGGGIVLSGASEVAVSTVADMAETLERGSLARATAATGMNARSSRSHAVFSIHLEARRKPGCEEAMAREYVAAKLHLVDLAGSERAKRTKAEGKRFQEGVHINQGLLALGNVISALSAEAEEREGTADGAPAPGPAVAKRHIPYRDSKLTRLLQDSLGGNSRTVMIACVSPADSNLEETLNTLKYAGRARNIRNTLTVNCDSNAEEVVRLRQQLAAAHATIRSLKKRALKSGGGDSGRGGGSGGIGGNSAAAAREIAALRADNQRLADALMSSQSELAAALSTIGGNGAEALCGGEMSAEEVDAAGVRLAELNQSLEAKQATLLRVSADGRQVEVLKAHYERQMTSIEAERATAERERDELMNKLEQAKGKSGAEQSKLQAKFKEKVKALEAKVAELNRKARQASQLEGLQRRSAQAVARLKGDVESIKRQRVQLEQRLRREAKAFQKDLQIKNKEIMSTRREGEKSKANLAKLKGLHERQAAVLKQKMSELAAASKRLKESVDRRAGIAADKRERQQARAGVSRPWSSTTTRPATASSAPSITASELTRRIEEEVKLAVQLDGARRGLAEERARLEHVTAQRDIARQALGDARTAGVPDEARINALKAEEASLDLEVIDAGAAIARDEATIAAAEKALEAARGAAVGAPRKRIGSDMKSSADASAALATLADKLVASAVDVASAKEARGALERRAEAAERELAEALERTAALEAAASKASKRVSLCMTGTPTPKVHPQSSTSPLIGMRTPGPAAAPSADDSEELAALGRDVRASVMAAGGLFAQGLEEALATPSVPPGTTGRRGSVFEHPSEEEAEGEADAEGELEDEDVTDIEESDSDDTIEDPSDEEWRATPMHRRRPAKPVSHLPNAGARATSRMATRAVAAARPEENAVQNRRYSSESDGSAAGDSPASLGASDASTSSGEGGSKTRVQRAEIVAYLKEKKGVTRLPAPVVNGTAVSLPTLASVIWELGGPAIVEAERLWDRVADKVGVGMTGARATAARAAAGVHRAYERHLEDFFMEWNPREEEVAGGGKSNKGKRDSGGGRKSRSSDASNSSSLANRPSWVDVVLTPATQRTPNNLTPTSRRKEQISRAASADQNAQEPVLTPMSQIKGFGGYQEAGLRSVLRDASNHATPVTEAPSPATQAHVKFSQKLRATEPSLTLMGEIHKTPIGKPAWEF